MSEGLACHFYSYCDITAYVHILIDSEGALQVFGWEQWALPVPDSSFSSPGTPPPNIVCRFALGILVYMGVYVLQVSFF